MIEMPCSRKKCNSVDCRIEVVGKGYICWECVEDLRRKLEASPNEMSKEEAKAFVYAFLETEKPCRTTSTT